MTTTKITFDQKIANIQQQLDVMRREDAVFRGHANKYFEFISTQVATKDDLGNVETRMASKEDLRHMEAKMASKDDLKKLTDIVTKIAEKVGVLS